MARGGFPGMGFGGANIGKLLKEAQKMQSNLQKSQEEIAEKIFETTAGGGAVTAKMSGARKLTELKIDEELISSGEKEMVEDIVMVAINDLLAKIEQEEKNLTSNINIPGLGF